MNRILFILIISLVYSCTIDPGFDVTNLRCEYMKDPAGMDVRAPRFSWIIESDERAIMQTSYRIIVSDNPEHLKNEEGPIWDSNEKLSDSAINIAYTGKPLTSNTTYFWKVGVKVNAGDNISWSEPAKFHTGLFEQTEWQAEWISASDTTLDAPLLRKAFTINKPVKQAFAFVTGLGYYEFYLNGKKAGDHVLDPAITDYSKRILYSTYDVTKDIVKGENVAGAFLGNGAYNQKSTENRWSWGGKVPDPGKDPLFIMQMVISYVDGTTEIIITDGSWKYSNSPVTFNNIFGGEDYDGTLQQDGWKAKGFDDSKWRQVKVAEAPGGVLSSQMMPPIRVIATLNPVKHTNPQDGVFLYDLGQNYAGWWRITLSGEKGAGIRVRGAETLNDSLFAKPLADGDQLSIKQRYHADVWTDYTLSGKGTEIYEPVFFYTGLRYIEITTDSPEKVRIGKVEGRVAGTDLEETGSFNASDSLINKIHRATVWAQRGNIHGYPTDCPHREKGGYTGDGQVIAEASMHDFQMGAFYTKWLNDMRDAQQENGKIPNTAPTLVGGMGGGIAWGSAYILIPWWMYQYYDDRRILEDHYNNMKQFIGYLRNLARTDSIPSEPYIINFFDGYWYSLGEWCAPGESDCPEHAMVNTSYFYMNSRLMSKIASVLGKQEDVKVFSSLADTLKEEINKRFFKAGTNTYATDSTYQTYQILALAFNLVPEELRDEVFNTLVKDIQITRKGHLNTGILGTKYIWPVLVNSGKSDLAWSIVKTTTWPGYGYWIENGATTLLEQWDGKNSHNHQMFGSVDEYFYKYLAGISSPEDGLTTRGYRHIHIQPYIPEGLSYSKATVKTLSGEITSEWKKENGKLNVNAIIPSNSTATIKIPVMNANVTISESGSKIWEDGRFIPGTKGVEKGEFEGGFVKINVGSGDYRILVER